MSKSVRYKDGTRIMDGTLAWELYHNPPKPLPPQPKTLGKSGPAEPLTLAEHMTKCDIDWRKHEGRKPINQLTEREKMLEGRIPWDPVRLKELIHATSN